MSDLGTRLGLALVALVASANFCYRAYLVYIEQRIIKRIQKFGVMTTGRIVIKYKKGWGRETTYYVIYRFRTGDPGFKGQMFTRTQPISYSHFERLQPRQPVTVCYLLENPHISRLSGDDSDNTERDGSVAVMFLAVLVWVGIVYVISILWMK